MTTFKNFMLIWGKKTLKALSLGIIVFALFMLFAELSVAIFLGIFSAYMYIGAMITEHSQDPFFIYDFCDRNWKVSIDMIVISIIGFIFFSTVTVITWPLLIAGILLFIACIIGAFGATMLCHSDDPVY